MNFINNIEKVENLVKVNPFPTITMYRANFGMRRGYIQPLPFKIFSGLTGALESATPKGDVESKGLETWRKMHVKTLGSFEAQESFLDMMADFGTLLHQCIVRIKENRSLDMDYEADYAATFFKNSALKNNIQPMPHIIAKQVEEYQKSAASILQFVYDNVVEIHAIEAMCYNDELSIATPVDIVCTIKTKDGDMVVSLNLKTSTQFSKHHRKQVALEKYLWNSTYPDNKVVKTGLFRPKQWSWKKGIPTYEWELLDEQEEQEILSLTLEQLLLCKKDKDSDYSKFPAGINKITGIMQLGEAPKLMYKTMEELWNEEQVN